MTKTETLTMADVRPDFHDFFIEIEKYAREMEKKIEKRDPWKFKSRENHEDNIRSYALVDKVYEDNPKGAAIEAAKIAYSAFAIVDNYIN